MAQRQYSRADLMNVMAESWQRLNRALDNLSEEEMTGIKDAQGWSVKDHLTHMTAWERSIVYFLRRKPRHEGLNVPEELYQQGEDDPINAHVQRQTEHLSIAQAREEMARVHGELLSLVEEMSEDDLYMSYSHYQPDAPRLEGDTRVALGAIHSNTAAHWDEHLEWIEHLVGKGAGGTQHPEGRA